MLDTITCADKHQHTDTKLHSLFKHLCMIVELDKQAQFLYGQGYLSTYPASNGQEIGFVAAAHALDHHDVYVPYYRDNAGLLVRNNQVDDILKYWGGYKTNITPYYKQDHHICVPVASQTTHAVGAAYALKHRNKNQLVFCSLGDGASSKGDFYEALNFACVEKLPIMFCINVNKWSISTPIIEQTMSIEKKFSGFDAIHTSINNNDLISAYKAVLKAREATLSTLTPSIIYYHSTRLCPHTVTDDFSKYADADEIKKLKDEYDIIETTKSVFTKANIDQNTLKNLENEAREYVVDGVKKFKTFCKTEQERLKK